MLMSISTSEGLSSSSRETASLPFAASPTNSNSAVRFSTAFMAARNGAWSSTMRTEGRSLTCPFSHGASRGDRGGGTSAPVVVSPSAGVAQVDQHRLDATVDVSFLRQVELGEDGVGVLLHCSLGDLQRGGDGGIALALRHLPQDLGLPR